MQYYQNIGDYNQAKQLFDQYYKIRTSISENIYLTHVNTLHLLKEFEEANTFFLNLIIIPI